MTAAGQQDDGLLNNGAKMMSDFTSDDVYQKLADKINEVLAEKVMVPPLHEEILLNYTIGRERLWYLSYQQELAAGNSPRPGQQAEFKREVRRIEKSHGGKKNLLSADACTICQGALIGRVAVLAWVLGAEWHKAHDAAAVLALSVLEGEVLKPYPHMEPNVSLGRANGLSSEAGHNDDEVIH